MVARASEPDRTRLDRVLAVLRVAPAEASAACLASMRDVHALEQQRPAPSDELEFSYQNAAQLCGADAERVCRSRAAMSGGGVCKVLDAPS